MKLFDQDENGLVKFHNWCLRRILMIYAIMHFDFEEFHFLSNNMIVKNEVAWYKNQEAGHCKQMSFLDIWLYDYKVSQYTIHVELVNWHDVMFDAIFWW